MLELVANKLFIYPMICVSKVIKRAIGRLLGICLFLTFAILAQSVSANNQSNLQVTTHKIASGYAVKASMTVNFSPDKFLALVNNSAQDCAWIYHCKKVEILASKSQSEQIMHTSIDVAWPFKDRDMIAMARVSKSADSLVIEISDQSSFAPEQKRHVRMTDVVGKWEMIKMADNTYLLTYSGSANPNGLIPDWFVDEYLVESTTKTFLNVKAHFAKQE